MSRSRIVWAMLAAWAVHDAEEVITEPAVSRELVARVPAWVPLPDDIRRHGLTRAHVNVAVSLMGIFMGAATADGLRTRGEGRFFQTVLDGFGWHGLGHLAQVALLRRYTPGAVTAPVVVIPFWLWSRRALAREGVAVRRPDPRTLLVVPPLLLGVHTVARAVTATKVDATPPST